MNGTLSDDQHLDARNSVREQRTIALPITRHNFAAVACIAGMSVAELNSEIQKAEADFRKQKNREWAINLFRKDEKWFDDALATIEAIRATLPKDMDPKEKIIRLYGWIADTVEPSLLTQPMMADSEFRRADSVYLILTNPALYLKIRNWD